MLARGLIRGLEEPEVVPTAWGLFEIRDCRESVQSDIYFRGRWEPAETALVCRLLGPGATFVDAGANLGWYTVVAARCVGAGGRVHAFEPAASLYGHLVRNLELNGLGQVVVARRAALARQGGRALLRGRRPDNQGLGSIVTGQGPGEEVPTLAFDDYREEAGLGTIDLMKIDVEGAEMMVLEGMARTLASGACGALLLEVGGPRLAAQGYSARAVVERLQAHGYRVEALLGGRLRPASTLPVLETRPDLTLLARRPGA
jgi:FkbM family methyltransferase